MKIGVISDIHGDLFSLKSAFEELTKKEIKLVLVLGDVLYHGPRNPMPEGYNPMGVATLINEASFNFIFVKGNCDAEVDNFVIRYPLRQEFSYGYVDGMSILMNHGDRFEDAKQILQHFKNIDIFLTGHTHKPVVEETPFGIHINPGSISLPKGGSKKSFAILDVEDGKFFVEFKEIP